MDNAQGVAVPYAVEKDVIDNKGVEEEWYRITFPNGSRMLYTEVPSDESAYAHHKYWRLHPDGRRGQQISGASTMTSTFDLKSEALNSWIGREAARTGDADPGKDKRDLGTRVHAYFEALANSEIPTPPHESDIGYVRAVLDWWETRQPEVIAAEQFVYHGDVGYGGRYDLRARVDGRVQLIDLKTANNLYAKYGAQLVAYDYAAEWCGIGAADDLLVLKVCPDGRWFEVPAFVTRQEFLAGMGTRGVAQRVQAQQRAHLKEAA